MKPKLRKVLKIKTGEIISLSDFVIDRLKKDGKWKDMDLLPEAELKSITAPAPDPLPASEPDSFPDPFQSEEEKPKKKKKSESIESNENQES